MGKYIRGPVDEDLSLGTLAALTGIRQAFGSVVAERTLISSLVARYSLQGMTPGDNIGPIMVGIAHGDYSLSEIEAYIEQTTGWSEGDLVSQEISSRKIRRIGVFESAVAGGTGGITVLNDGKPIKTKLNWILISGQSIAVWAYNMGSGALATTDPNVQLQGHANLWPK